MARVSGQGEFDFARGQGTAAANACVEKAEVVAGFNATAARAHVLVLLRQRGPTSGEDLVDALKDAGFRGHDDRCFGPVFAVLVRARKIRCAGYCTRRRGHGTAGGRIWELAA
jgi:hypothetical protein